MKTKTKKSSLVKITITTVALLLLSFLFFQLKAKSAVESFLERKIPAHIALNYNDLSVNLLAGKIQFSKIDLKIRDRDTTLNHTIVKIKDMTIDGLSYWQFFLRNTVRAKEVLVESPYVTYYPSKTFREKSDKSKGVVNLLKNIAIGKISIANGSFDMAYQQNDSIQIYARALNFSLIDGKTNAQIIQQKIPITYDAYVFSAANLFVDLSPFETAKAEALMITETDAKLTNFILQSKYSKAALSKLLVNERDHIDLKIPECSLKNIAFGFKENRFFFASQFGEVEKLNLNIFRDKLVADDPTVKKMYSSVLRELPFNLNIDSLTLVNSYIKYEENTKRGAKAGSLFFDDVNLKLKNISNTYAKGSQTTANVKGELMGVAPFTVAYSFDINDEDDAFTVATTLFALDGKHVNSFLRPNLNAQIKGQVSELYFTTTGNRHVNRGDMKMKYEDFKFEILKNDRLKINKVLSVIGNLFINDGSDADAQGYRYGTIDVERDPNKSLFNYMWISTQDGLLSTLTGDGKKEDN